MSVVKLKEEKQKKLKTLSKIVEVLAKIGKVFCYIALVFAALAAIIVPMIIKNIDIKDNEILYSEKTVLKLVEEDNKLVIKVGESIAAEEKDPEKIQEIKEFFEKNQDNKILNIGYIELGILGGVATLILTIFLLKHLEKLSKNINKEDTPFTLENVEHFRKIGYILIALFVIPAVISGILEGLVSSDSKTNFHFDINIVELLFIFIIAHIFEYGCEIQKDSKGKIYGNEKD